MLHENICIDNYDGDCTLASSHTENKLYTMGTMGFTNEGLKVWENKNTPIATAKVAV